MEHQAANRLELELDGAHWDAVDALRENDAPFSAADVDRERAIREAAMLAAANTEAIARLWGAYAKSHLYGEGERRRDRLAAELRRRNA